MPATFDGENLIITLPAATDQINVQVDLYSDWKEWFKTGDNAKYPRAFRTIGGDPLTANIDAGAYYFLRNDLGWRIKPAEEDATVQIEGNLAPQDASLPTAIPTTGAYTVLLLGLQPITQNVDGIIAAQAEALEFASFQNRITVDLTSPYSGTGTDPLVGTMEFPVNNFPDALLISAARGLPRLYIIGDATLAVYDFSGMIIEGENYIRTTITILPTANVTGTEFYDATITGTLDSNATLNRCVALDITAGGHVHHCVLKGTITLSGDIHLVDCVSGVSGVSTPIVDFNGTPSEFELRNYNGGIGLRNKSGTESASLDMNSGQVILESTVTAGVVVVRGDTKLIDSSGPGCTVIDETTNTKIQEMHRLAGLDAANPMVVSATSRKVPADGSEIDLDITEVDGTVTVERQ